MIVLKMARVLASFVLLILAPIYAGNASNDVCLGQMEDGSHSPCAFPFPYNRMMHNECLIHSLTGRAVCVTESQLVSFGILCICESFL